MFTRVCLSLALLLTPLARSQSTTNAREPDPDTADKTPMPYETPMLIPPPVNGGAYPTALASETPGNYLRAGLTTNTMYSDNVFADANGRPISDVSYSIWPTIAIDRTTPRLHWGSIYSPGFTFYQRTTDRNQTDQNLALILSYRLSSHLTAILRDNLEKTSNIFNQPDSLSGGAVSGSPQPPLVNVIAPIADQLNNTANLELTYQFSASGMIGTSGTFTNLHYLDPAEVPGLYDSSSRGGSAFYAHRMSGNQYIGSIYQYSQIEAYPVNAQSETKTQSWLVFLTAYPKPTLSFSLSAGPHYADSGQPPLSRYRSWSPAATASMTWQGPHASFAASYLRLVTGVGGLVGAFQSDRENAFAHLRLARTWHLESATGYASNKNVTPSFLLTTPGGHSFYGTVSLKHTFTDHLEAEFGYTRLHQSYTGIPVISSAPDTDREFFSVTYLFARPL